MATTINETKVVHGRRPINLHRVRTITIDGGDPRAPFMEVGHDRAEPPVFIVKGETGRTIFRVNRDGFLFVTPMVWRGRLVRGFARLLRIPV